MGRGIVLGGLLGLVFSGLVLALTSQLTERRSLPAPEVSQPPQVPSDAEPTTPEDVIPAPEMAPDAPVVPKPEPAVAGPHPDGGSAPVTPSDAPGLPLVPAGEAALPTAPAAPVIPGVPDAPILPAPETGDAAAPGTPTALQPVQPAVAASPATLAGDVPPVVAPSNGRGPGAVAIAAAPVLGSGALNDTAPLPPAQDSTPGTSNAPQAPVGPGPVMSGLSVVLPGVAEAAGTAPVAPTAQAAPAQVAPPAPPAVPASEAVMGRPAALNPITLAVVAAGLGASGTPEKQPVAPDKDAIPPEHPRPQAPAEGMAPAALPVTEAAPPATVAVPAVVVDRLPRIGDPVDLPEAESVETVEADEAPPLAADALTRNGVPFDNPDGRPIVSVVLLDHGGEPVHLPFAVSVAIDAAAPDAAQRAAEYRAAGVEVVLIAQIPEGALASDVSVALQDTFRRIPDAVALLDSPEGELQVNREVTAQVLSELADTGHGLLTFPRGLNTVLQLAEREGVVAGNVFREIDAGDLDVRGIKRFLDQAAFRARQEDSVILVGRNVPETIAALAEWALGNRAASVALVPVSAALRAAAR